MRSLDIALRDDIAIVTFNVPSLSASLRPEIAHALDVLEAEDSIQAVVLTGRKNVFITGADLDELLRLENRAQVDEFLELPRRIIARLCFSNKFTIAAINGYCLGGGLEFALACDFRFCTDAFGPNGAEIPFLGFPESTLGLTTAMGGAFLASTCLGPGRARELLVSGRLITAHEACAIGLADDRVTREGFLDAALAQVRQLLRPCRTSPRLLKKTLRREAFRQQLKEAQAAEGEAFADCLSCEQTSALIRAERQRQRTAFRGALNRVTV